MYVWGTYLTLPFVSSSFSFSNYTYLYVRPTYWCYYSCSDDDSSNNNNNSNNGASHIFTLVCNYMWVGWEEVLHTKIINSYTRSIYKSSKDILASELRDGKMSEIIIEYNFLLYSKIYLNCFSVQRFFIIFFFYPFNIFVLKYLWTDTTDDYFFS